MTAVPPKTRKELFERIAAIIHHGEIDFDAREAKPGSKGLRNHGTKFRVSPKEIRRLYGKKKRLG